jgi:hypothetical protein
MIKKNLITKFKSSFRKLSRFILKIQTFIFMFILYFAVFVPIGLLYNLQSLNKRKGKNTYWKDIEEEFKITNYYKQY